MKNIRIESSKAIVNDTGKYALQVNFFFGLFDSKEEAQQAYHTVFDQYDSIDDSPYGSIGILPPGYRETFRTAKGTEELHLSELQAVNIVDYAVKNPQRRNARLGLTASESIDKLAGKSALPVRLVLFKAEKHNFDLTSDDFWEHLVVTKWTPEDSVKAWLEAVPDANPENYRFEQRFSRSDEWDSKSIPTPKLP